MAKSAPVTVFVHAPASSEGKACLARRAAAIHAAYVMDAIGRLDCPAEQRQALLQAVKESIPL